MIEDHVSAEGFGDGADLEYAKDDLISSLQEQVRALHKKEPLLTRKVIRDTVRGRFVEGIEEEYAC